LDRQPVLLLVGCAVLLMPLFVGPARSGDACPKYPLGVTSKLSESGETYYATASIRPFKDDETSSIEAQQDARNAARLLLRKDKRVPLGSNGRLQGAIDEGSCVSGGRVYASVSLNSKSAAQAIELDERLRKSLATKPTPQIPSYSRVDGAGEDFQWAEIERLLKR